MANYQESTVSGTEYTRCCEIQIINPVGKAPAVKFFEERVTNLNENRQIVERIGEFTVGFDPEKTINLYDPTTLQPTGQSLPASELYGYIFGAYFTYATERDNSE